MNPFRRISMRSSFSLQSRPQQNIVSENNVCTGNCRLNQRSEFALVHVVGCVFSISLTEMCIPNKRALTIRRIHIYTIWTLWTPQRTTNDWDNLCKFNRKLLIEFRGVANPSRRLITIKKKGRSSFPLFQRLHESFGKIEFTWNKIRQSMSVFFF